MDGKLCSESGEPVMLRGVSTNGLITAEDLLNEPLFEELSRDDGVNLVRLAMYTYGVGVIGYCTNGDKDRHKADIVKGVELARSNDMYVLVDWHILSDGDPNSYLDEAKLFFAEMAERFADYDNVLYEICNEPNGQALRRADHPRHPRQGSRVRHHRRQPRLVEGPLQRGRRPAGL